MTRLITRAFYYFDYLFPREVVVPVVMVFSLENVIDTTLGANIPPGAELKAWSAIFIAALLVNVYWGDRDEHGKKEVEDVIDEVENDA